MNDNKHRMRVKDPLGMRMKEFYEDRTRMSLPRRTFTVIRLDGKAFHTYTRGLQKPFDNDLSTDIDDAVCVLMQNIQGAKLAYCQSDEISIVVTDFDKIGTGAWFDGNIQKMVSVSSSILTAEFNKNRILRELTNGTYEVGFSKDLASLKDLVGISMAYFDSRVFTIPELHEVYNYLIWRNKDCIRNSVSMVAQSVFSHKQLEGKSRVVQMEMLKDIGKNWEYHDDRNKYGRVIVNKTYIHGDAPNKQYERHKWESIPAWEFVEGMDSIKSILDIKPNE